jgi:ribulose-5-phosphate 4-epimerase/fuculose-1-phosphate aldolase
MKNQITTFSLTAKLGLFFNPSRSAFEFLKKKNLILINLETGPYKGGGKFRGEDI